jgi:flagellar biosynthesis protein FlhA
VGIPTKEPTFGLDAVWIVPELRAKAEEKGYTVVDAPSVLATHLSEVVKSKAADLLTRQTVQEMVNMVRESAPAVVEEMTRSLGLGEVQKVLQNLVRENVPIRDLAGIFETLADYGRSNQSSDFLSEKAREGLSRTIVSRYVPSQGDELSAVTLSPDWESLVRESVQGNLLEGWRIKMPPDEIQNLVRSVGKATEPMVRGDLPQVLLVHPDVRFYIRRILERTFPNVAVLAYSELDAGVRLKTLGVVTKS